MPEETTSDTQTQSKPESASAYTGHRGGLNFKGATLQGTFASLKYRDFTLLWLGQITHAAALWLEQTARPLLILALTDSAIHLGMVILARTIPAVFLGVLAGVLADNFNRRTILVATKVMVFVLSIIFALIVATGIVEIWHIYVFSFLRGAAMAFDQPARRAIIPSIVPENLVVNAMALSTGSMTAMRIIGASGAGLLMGFYGLAAPFIVIVFVYIFALIFTWMLNPPDHERSGYQGARRMGSDLADGFRYSAADPTIRGVLIIGLGYFLFGMAFMQVFAPLFAKQVLGIGETGFGFMVSVMGIGGLIGALGLATFSPTRNRGTLMLGFLAAFGALLILFSGVTYLNSVVLAFIVVIFLGAGQSLFFPLMNAILVESAPEAMRGRVMGVLSLDRAMTALGGALAGIAAGAMGVQITQIIFGVGCLVTAILMYTLYPALRRVQ
ncbi:MAG: MFS transporter [SAR202 cluster bacterium]|nr:MFS transporter [SAR202 cluster bacterium]|tara:strand:- start:9184 stop:10509 length:1326 start_codon:yes stop_codon:yes gene_type:complete